MRALWVALVLLPPIASASRSDAVNGPSLPSAMNLFPTTKVRLNEQDPTREVQSSSSPAPQSSPTGVQGPPLRLREIDDALYPLEVRPTAGRVFLQTGERLLPIFVIAGAPALGLGLALGFIKANVDSADSGVGRVLSGAGLGLVVVAGALLVVCAFKLIDHWVEEADSAPARNARIRELKAERQALLAPQAH